MAALMRSARFCNPAVQIPKLLRAVCSPISQTSARLLVKERPQPDLRSWRSTLAEGVETPAPTSTKLETMMSTLDRYVRQFGRVSRKQLDPVVSCLDEEGTISLSSSLNLLRLHGTALFDEPPARRLKLAEELWEKYKKHGVPLDVMHYNTLLAVYNINKLQFSPSEFLANMEASGVQPNRITYQRLIARFCEDGDIQGATQVLEHMKAASMPINDHVFNSFIIGHLRCNDPDSARNIVEVMRQTGLEPTSMTYTVLATGFAEKGEIEEVKKYISQAETESVPLRPGQLLEVYAALAESGHSQHLSQLFPFLHSGTPFNADAVRVCCQLISTGFDDAAYQLFLEMPKPSRMEADQTTLGRFFLRAMARHQRPVDKVVELVKDMQRREVNRDDLSGVAHLAYLEDQPAFALTMVAKMKEEGLPVRAHYFWPALCQFRDNGDKQGIYDAMEQMTSLCHSRDDFSQTLHGYTIPALLALGDSQADIIDKLQKCDLAKKDIQFAFFLWLLEGSQLQEALRFMEENEMLLNMVAIKACLSNIVGKDMDLTLMLQILGRLKTQMATWQTGTLKECNALVLRQVLQTQRKADWADTQSVFSLMDNNNLKILRRHQAEMAEYFAGAPPEVLQRLEGLVSENPRPEQRERGELVFSSLSLEELKQQAKDKPDNKAVLKRLLIKACAVGDKEVAERVEKRLEEEGFVFPPIVLSQLSYLYATFVKDLPKACTYLQQLEERFPEHWNYQPVVLQVAALHAASGDTDAAVDCLKSYADKHSKMGQRKEPNRVEENYKAEVVRCAVDMASAKRLMEVLTECGYLPADNSLLLNNYMEKVVDSGDTELILKEFEEIVKTHKNAPKVNSVMQFFINKEDPDSLQKVVDQVTEVHGLANVLHHLIANLIECGHTKKARKIIETPGLRASMPRLGYFCQRFIEKDMITELEMLVEVTKDMFAIDRDIMLFHLIRGYVKRKDLDKAKGILLQYEEEMLQPSARTLRFLARSLEAAKLPVPFEVPEFQPPQPSVEKEPQGRKKENAESETAATQLKEALERGDVQAVLTAVKGDKELLDKAISQMKKPWPTSALTAVFEGLAQQGDLDSLNALNENRLPMVLQHVLKAQVFTAAINSGRGQEVIDKLESTTTRNSAKYLTFPVLDMLSHSAPDLLDRVESATRKLQAEKNYTEPLSILWCYYKYHDSPRADRIMQEVPDFERLVLTGTLCSAAVNDNKLELLESVLKMKQDLGEKPGMAVAYSALLRLHAGQGDVEGVQKTCDRLMGDGLQRSSLRRQAVEETEAVLTKNNHPLPAWGDEASSESSSGSSSSSSDDENSPQRS